ncbi:hypothetical protein M0D70_06915 [Acinetobacter portensis]|uniref:SCP2 domain-containing protein n=2 Tax=Acinetobacter TaxID=469 RepID=A0A6L6GFL6_9GAMM|nr:MULTISPECIES: hypothetical protein [Acinetobacter]MCK7609084.1 hypothetical protein [Acinetobacter portensis]MCK7639898.1 hypothetical protein [Acinetobacter portensis]MDY6458213.1 hypothetical protein [Acinetobacter faecalis]MDY6460975.1 hypothetical protein [Acinetobacter faecalis]MDY6484507.1 hypothetical protein [Acinetobacter faecalis]
MSESQQRSNETHLLLNTVLIILETIFTLVLKHDRVIALQAKKFVENKVSIKINSYIPFFDIYVQFNEHGILFDLKAPTQAVDLDVRTSLMDLIKIFLLGNKRSIKAMRIDGDVTLKDEFKDLLLLFNAPKILSDWQNWLKEPIDEQNIETSKKRIAPLLDKIDQQRSKINSLQVDIKQHKNRLRRIQKNQKRLNILFITIIVLLSTLLVYNILA